MKKLFFSLRRIVRSAMANAAEHGGKVPKGRYIITGGFYRRKETRHATSLQSPVRDKIRVEHVAYLTARPCLRGYPISTNIPSLRDATLFVIHHHKTINRKS